MKSKNLELIKIILMILFYCKNLNLDIVGLMCIPPANDNLKFFLKKWHY
jgi:uncharacterized pyridoxal phosphate-containing UPF0001 family protein